MVGKLRTGSHVESSRLPAYGAKESIFSLYKYFYVSLGKISMLEFLSAVFLLLFGTGLQASELVAKAVQDPFQESFDRISPNSGIPLAGLILGKTSGTVNVSDVILVSPLDNDGVTCVTARTRDGRYYSENQYDIPSATNTQVTAKLDPVTKKYGEQLKEYPSRSFVLLGSVLAGTDCGSANNYFLPRAAGANQEQLTLSINSGSGSSYVTASLRTDGDGEHSKFLCNQLRDEANIAFDTECVANIAPYRGQIIKVKVVLDDGISAKPYTYSVLIPVLRN